MAVWLAFDEYTHIADNNYISVTGLLKPIKAIILSRRVVNNEPSDILDFVASRTGTALHSASENAWLNGNYKKSLHKLGYAEDYIDRITVNPSSVAGDDIPVFLERRTIKEIHSYKVGGQFDVVISGEIRDIKSVKAFSYMKGDDKDYILQMSIYKWLNQSIITGDVGYIDMIITDWKAHEAASNPNYPRTAVVEKVVQLMSIEETEAWLSNRLNSIHSLVQSDEVNIPSCTTAELWQDATKYKYYSKLDSKRATKVFDNITEANQMLIDKGSKGYVKTVEGMVRRCNYCNGKDICQQYKGYVTQGLV